ncbi:MAG: TldD/PmbA family protein [Candidatus Coatesbacteria bacterium]|nr:MAG: TldD/PmbA family protein [Candidatus Coatesbacteria bacterium]RLC42964.1 MAG: TldD/PmbA family protein [Candidatus Coatesbacteria bacterium]
MESIIEWALEVAKREGATYADIRIEDYKRENITVKDEMVEGITHSSSIGYGIRVIVDGCWGFSASNRLEKKEVERVAKQACDIARASSLTKVENVLLDDTKPQKGKYKTPMEIDPFSVPIQEKVDYILSATREMKKEKDVKIAQGFYTGFLTKKTFATLDGAYIEQEICHCGGGISATAIGKDDMQVRSYPNSFRGNFATAGYEYFKGLELDKNAPKIASEVCALLKAKECPEMKGTIIIDGNQLALQVHESCGHPIELDRVFGTEASFAGTSFLTTDKLDKLKYGSPIVNIVADATVKGGLGTFGYDDEGVPAQRTDVVKDGLFVGYLMSRETAPKIGRRSNGAMRADGWHSLPIIRMTNINLLPGDWELDDLIADTDDGIFVSTNKSWSIDDKRVNFQFGCEIAWKIENGKLTEIYKNPVYYGITTNFWNSCDAICNRNHWKLWGTPNCGKGEPMQTMYVGHGTSPSRFRNISIGVKK